MAAIARWAAAEYKGCPVTLVTSGERSSLLALVAAALEEKAVAGVELHGSLGSLKEVIERDWSVNQKPELFCFGLLEAFDLKQIAALVAPRPVKFAGPSDRVKKEMAALGAWYKLLGGECDPLK